jgi:hypothetical protein
MTKKMNDIGLQKNEFFDYCKSYYAKGGVYGDEVNATDNEIRLGILNVMKSKNFRFEGDSFDRERVRWFIERIRSRNMNPLAKMLSELE